MKIHNPVLLNKQYLEQKYIADNLSAKEIASLTGFSVPFIFKKIKEFNIPRNKRIKNIRGRKFGLLTVLDFSHLDKNNASIWSCQCDCGNITKVKSVRLQDGTTKSCGCYKKVAVGDINGDHWNNIKFHAKNRNLELSIDINYIWNLFLQQDKKCALSGIDIVLSLDKSVETTASLDRIDSSKGYTKDNVQWVHKNINRMKSDMNQEVFLNWIKIINNFNNK